MTLDYLVVALAIAVVFLGICLVRCYFCIAYLGERQDFLERYARTGKWDGGAMDDCQANKHAWGKWERDFPSSSFTSRICDVCGAMQRKQQW